MRVTACETAENHADGTYSLRRGGLDRWAGDLPFEFDFVLFIEVDRSEVHGRNHEVIIKLSGVLQGEFVAAGIAPMTGDVSRYIVPLHLKVEKYGTITFDVELGDARASARFLFARNYASCSCSLSQRYKSKSLGPPSTAAR